MRIAVIVKSDVMVNANYRALMLVNVLRERGHEVPWFGTDLDQVPLDVFASCDLIHMYRLVDVRFLRELRRLQARGVALTWDNDDDIEAIDPDAPQYDRLGGVRGVRDFVTQKQALRQADAVTTTSRALAEKFRRCGARHVTVVENYLPREFIGTPRPRHRGIVVGWVAAGEHVVDAARLGVAETVASVLGRRRDLRVTTLGARGLELEHERYQHLPYVPFAQLVPAMAQFDIGIAPLADIPFNRARSTVKLKEYAAAGVPWLASPVGEYVGLGSEHGGRLVSDDGWPDAILALAGDRRGRRSLAKRARGWAAEQTLASNVGRWEEVFEGAIEGARHRSGAARRSPTVRRARARPVAG